MSRNSDNAKYSPPMSVQESERLYRAEVDRLESRKLWKEFFFKLPRRLIVLGFLGTVAYLVLMSGRATTEQDIILAMVAWLVYDRLKSKS